MSDRSKTETLDEYNARIHNGAGTHGGEERSFLVTGTVRLAVTVFAGGPNEAQRIGADRLRQSIRDAEIVEVGVVAVEES